MGKLRNLLIMFETRYFGFLALAVLATIILFFSIRGLSRFHAINRQPYTVIVFYNSVNLKPEDVAVIKLLVGKKADEINRNGGIAGRPVKVEFLDDKGSRERVYRLVKNTINNKDLIAYLGLWGSSRVEAVADLVGKEGVPFIGGYSVNSIAAAYPNMYSYEIGVEQVAFVINDLLKTKAGRVAFVGNAGDIYSQALLRKLKLLQAREKSPAFELVMEKWYPVTGEKLKTELPALLDSLEQKADLLLLSANPDQSNLLIGALGERKINLSVFTAFSDIPELDHKLPGFRDREFYDISVFGIPSALNMRCQEMEARYQGELQKSNRLQFQLGLGGLQADALGLIHAAAEAHAQTDLPIREKINRGMTGYINGKRIFRGWFSDWYFTPDRMLVNEVLLGWKPSTMEKPVLAERQFLRSEPGRQVAPVLYTNLDLQQIDQISDEKGTFNASFFLEINAAEPVALEEIDFMNAVRNEVDQKPLLAVKVLQIDSARSRLSRYHYLYRITGQFYFKPALQAYPFDKQRFSISLQSNNATRPFLIQPPYYRQPGLEFASPGWEFKEHFVGFDQDLIYSASSIVRKTLHIPSYKFSYTYVLKRVRVDFFLKVLTPLLVLLVIAYLAVFVPIREFVSVALIQVTALLSAIALYFSAYKPAMAAATISDKIFIFAYVMITTMIGASVLQYWLYRRRRGKRQLSIAVSVYERLLFPVIVGGFIYYLTF